MVYLRGRIAYTDNVTLAAFDGIVIAGGRVDFPPYAVLVMERVDKHIPYLRVVYSYDCSLLLVLPFRIEVNRNCVAVVVFKHLSEEATEVSEIELQCCLFFISKICSCRYLLNRNERPTLQLIDGPMLKSEVNCGVEACVLLSPLRYAQGHDVFLPLKLYFPVKREVRHYLSVYLDLRGDGFLAHVGDAHGCL